MATEQRRRRRRSLVESFHLLNENRIHAFVVLRGIFLHRLFQIEVVG